MSKFRILIVEDDPSVQELYLSGFAAIENVDIIMMESGQKAVEPLTRVAFDCIILDIKLPGIDGLQLVSIARENKRNRSTPIYIVSGSLDPMIEKISKNLGVLETIEKPIDIDSLTTKIEQQLKSKKTLPQYDSRVIHTLIVSSLEIFQHILKIKILVGRPKMKDKDHPPRGLITAIIPIQGKDFGGSLALSSNREFAENLAKRTFEGNEITIDDDLLEDIIGETCNQITGKVQKNFLKIGQKISFGLPKIVLGKQKNYHSIEESILFIPVGKDNMGCDLEFCFSQSDILALDDIEEDSKAESEDDLNMIIFD